MTPLPRPTTHRYLRILKLALCPIAYFEDYYAQLGDIFAVGNEDNPFIYLSNPQAIQTVFSSDRFALTSSLGRGFMETLLGANSVLFLTGSAHQRQRKLLLPPFLGERLRTYSQIITDIAQDTSNRLPLKQPFRLREVMQNITLNVILQVVFGLHQGDRYEQLNRLIAQLLSSLSSPLSALVIFFPILQKNWGKWSAWGRFTLLKAEIDRLLYEEIAERRDRGIAGTDILSLLMMARDENDRPLSDIELRDELMTLLIAGHETTASALSWAFYAIHCQPDLESKLRFELANLGDSPTPDAIAALPYLTATCQETLRRYPIAPTTTPRIATETSELKGYTIPRGAIIAPCIYLVHHCPDIYPEPYQFQPERFLNRQFSPFKYFPFGGGDRRCIGMGLAMLEMKLVLATFLRAHHFQNISNRPIQPVRRGLTLAPPASLSLVALD